MIPSPLSKVAWRFCCAVWRSRRWTRCWRSFLENLYCTASLGAKKTQRISYCIVRKINWAPGEEQSTCKHQSSTKHLKEFAEYTSYFSLKTMFSLTGGIGSRARALPNMCMAQSLSSRTAWKQNLRIAAAFEFRCACWVCVCMYVLARVRACMLECIGGACACVFVCVCLQAMIIYMKTIMIIRYIK